MTSLATKLFGLPEEIVVGDPCPAHLYRWTIFGNSSFQVCLQHTVGDEGSHEFCQDLMQSISVGVARNLCNAEAPPCRAVPGQAAWMVLIGKKAGSRKNGPCN